MALSYPDNTIWYVRASAPGGKDVSEGSAVAIRLQKRGEPKTAKTYLLTCGHVVRGTSPGERTIRAWPPDVAYNDRQAKALKIDADFKELPAGALSPAERRNAADDWVILQVCDDQAAMAAPAVRKWADDPLSGNFRIWGYVGGDGSFPQDKVIPTRTADTFPLRDGSHGAIYLIGDGTRPGISGGGVFKEDDIQFGGIHRARFDDKLQVCAVSSLHIRHRLYELGYETVLSLPDAYVGELLQHGGIWRSALPSVFAGYVAEKTRAFVGREHVFARVQEFLTSSPRGYLTIIGEPGIGKSAITCELTRRMCCVSHFFIRSDGITKSDQFYMFVGDQLRDRFGIDTTSGLDDAPGIRLTRWLNQAAASLDGDKLVLVVDALDECDEVDKQDRAGNLLFLPRRLPDGVYFVLSRRALAPIEYHIRLETEPGVANDEFDLMTFSSENRRDVEQYLRAYFGDRPEHAWLTRHFKSVDEAVALLSERSEDNFMYLRHLLPHLENHPAEFAPERLPKGLTEYYSGHWERMTAMWREKPEAESVFLTIYVLAKARKSMTRGQIEATLRDVPARLVRTFIGQWREFLEEFGRDEPTYRIYHASFADFLAKQDAVIDAGREKKAAQLLKNWFLSRLRSGAAGS